MTDTPSIDIDRVNPYDNPDRRQLERKLQDDQRELREQHRTAEREPQAQDPHAASVNTRQYAAPGQAYRGRSGMCAPSADFTASDDEG